MTSANPCLSSLPADPADDFRPILEHWRAAGRRLVRQNHASLSKLIADAEAALEANDPGLAAARAQLAATHAVLWHSGTFVSPRLEAVLRAIGSRDGGSGALKRRERLPAGHMDVLHVATRVGAIGGHTRMMRHWITKDRGNRHSVALTRQLQTVPSELVAAAVATGGSIHKVNAAMGGLLSWARRLRSLMARADLVVLHVHNMDVVPFLALAGLPEPPRVILLDHADHLFWLGAFFADLVVNTRVSGAQLCQERRMIEAERNALLPLALEARERRLPPVLAKQRLGLATNAVVLVSIARATKYRRIGSMSFPESVLPVLKRHPQTVLLVVGPGGCADWGSAMAEVPGRILAFPEQADTTPFLDAADIYIDSFPFTSITSLFEAGLHGLPLVTRFPFAAHCAVFGSDLLHADSQLIRATSLKELHAVLDRLITDPGNRQSVGERVRDTIEQHHLTDSWQQALGEIYRRVLSSPPLSRDWYGEVPPGTGDLDCFLPFLFGNEDEVRNAEQKLARVTQLELRALPFVDRYRSLLQFRSDGRPRAGSYRQLLPEWLHLRVRWLMEQLSSSGSRLA